uniref:Uncharacterized protein n=1 Tax=Trichogramma kaykai TaxID=54128 RepID=A0ABD2X453_9HYME
MKPRKQSSHLLGDTSPRSCRGEIQAYGRFARPIGLPGRLPFTCSRCRGDIRICAIAWARATRREFMTAFPALAQSRNSSKKQTNPTARVYTIRIYPDLRKLKPTHTYYTRIYWSNHQKWFRNFFNFIEQFICALQYT